MTTQVTFNVKYIFEVKNDDLSLDETVDKALAAWEIVSKTFPYSISPDVSYIDKFCDSVSVDREWG